MERDEKKGEKSRMDAKAGEIEKVWGRDGSSFIKKEQEKVHSMRGYNKSMARGNLYEERETKGMRKEERNNIYKNSLERKAELVGSGSSALSPSRACILREPRAIKKILISNLL